MKMVADFSIREVSSRDFNAMSLDEQMCFAAFLQNERTVAPTMMWRLPTSEVVLLRIFRRRSNQ